MPITRTPQIDDDGTGTTGTVWNNAWKQELYQQIDQAAAVFYGTFVPVDISGDSLTFSTAVGTWAKVDRVVYVWLQVVYPATAGVSLSAIGGLPYPVRCKVGAWQGFGVHAVWYMPIDQNQLQPFNPVTGEQLINSAMAGRNVILSSVYLTDPAAVASTT